MTTTTKLGDFLGRGLTNSTPGTSDATDFLGRAVTASNKDFMGRSLLDAAQYPPANVLRSTAYALKDVRRIPNVKEVQTLTATGTPAVSFALSVTLKGVTRKTSAIAVSTLSAATIQAAVNALDNVDPGDVVVAGTGPWTFTFAEQFGDVALIAVDNALTTGGTYAASETTKGVVKGGIVVASVAGTTHASNLITQPAVGATVTDGTVTWKRLK